MSLSSSLAKSFASAANDLSESSTSNKIYGTVVGPTTVKLDGSTITTPCVSTVSINIGDRVIVEISSHTAIIIGNVTSPSYDNTATSEYVSKVLELDYLKADKIEITYATIENVEATYATIKNLEATNTKIDNLNTTYATIENVEATNGEIKNLKADTATITKLLAGNVEVTDTLTSIHITSDNVVIDDATITDAMIKNLSASKITSGSIYTTLVKIASSEKENHLLIDNATIQIIDSNKITRVQIGEDGDGDYSMYIWDDSGNLLWKPTGITNKGIGNGTIKNINVSDDAAIDGTKLNIVSVSKALNKDGSLIVTGSQVTIDDTTLSAVYKTMTQDISDNSDKVSVLQTKFEEVNGKITAKIWQSDINSSLKTIKDRYSELSMAIDEMSSKVEQIDMYSTNEESITDSYGNTLFDSSGNDLTGWNFVNVYSAVRQNADSITEEVTRATNAEGLLSASIKVNAEAIDLKVSKGDVVSEINSTPTTVKIAAEHIALEGLVTANNNFIIKEDGSVEATNGKFSGELVGAEGSFDGPVYCNDELHIATSDDSLGNGIVFEDTGTCFFTYFFGAFQIGGNLGEGFWIDADTYVTKKLHVDGNITASNISDSSWKTPSLESGIQKTSLGPAIQYRKLNNVVYIKGAIGITSKESGSSTLVFTLPEGYRPHGQLYFLSAGTGRTLSRWYVTTNGGVYHEWHVKLSDGSYVTDEIKWISIDISYPV